MPEVGRGCVWGIWAMFERLKAVVLCACPHFWIRYLATPFHVAGVALWMHQADENLLVDCFFEV